MRLPIPQIDTIVEIEQAETEYKTCKHAQSLLPQLGGSNTFSVLLTAWQSPLSSLPAIFAGTWELNVLLLEVKVGFASTRLKAALKIGETAPWMNRKFARYRFMLEHELCKEMDEPSYHSSWVRWQIQYRYMLFGT
jgi:hypothetical protein